MHTQIGVDDCSTDLDLRGMPVFRGLIGPMAEGKNVVRYESPDVFEALTKEWITQPAEKRRRRPDRNRKPSDVGVAEVVRVDRVAPVVQAENVVSPEIDD